MMLRRKTPKKLENAWNTFRIEIVVVKIYSYKLKDEGRPSQLSYTGCPRR